MTTSGTSPFEDWEHHEYCYLTTRGRVSGRPHTIEIWYVVHDGSAWLFTEPDGGTDWVRNLRRDPTVRLRIGDVEVSARAEVIEVSQEAWVRSAVAERYQHSQSGLAEWARGALVVRVTPER